MLSNTVNDLQAGDNGKVLKATATLSTVFTQKTATTATIQDTSTIAGLNLLNGLITATTVKAVANVAATASSITADPNSGVRTCSGVVCWRARAPPGLGLGRAQRIVGAVA